MKPTCIMTVWQRIAAVLVAVLLMASLDMVIIGGGHGAGVIGGILLAGNFAAWGFHQVLGWTGVLLTLAALACSQARRHARIATAGLVGVAATWTLFFLTSEGSSEVTLLTSIPLLVFSLIRGIQLWKL